MSASLYPTVLRSQERWGPDGSPFKGAFIEAKNATTKITVNVLSAPDSRYRVENLPEGEYELRVHAIQYKAEPHLGVKLAAADKVSVDFELQNGMVRWSDLSGYQGKQLLPEGKGKQLIERQCFACHMFQSRMAAVRRDKDGWEQAVNFMRTAMHSRLGDALNDQDADS